MSPISPIGIIPPPQLGRAGVGLRGHSSSALENFFQYTGKIPTLHSRKKWSVFS